MPGQPQMQKMHVPNQQIVLTSNQSPQHGGMQMQSISAQQQQQKPGPPISGQPQFIRTARYVPHTKTLSVTKRSFSFFHSTYLHSDHNGRVINQVCSGNWFNWMLKHMLIYKHSIRFNVPITYQNYKNEIFYFGSSNKVRIPFLSCPFYHRYWWISLHKRFGFVWNFQVSYSREMLWLVNRVHPIT